MKIGYLISSYLPKIGGAEACIHNLASGIIKNDHEAVVMTPCCGGGDTVFKYKVVRLNPLLNRLLFSNFSLGRLYLRHILRRLQRRYGFDLWQVTIGYPLGAASVDFFNENGIPCILRCSGEDVQTDPEVKYGYRLNKNIDSIIRKNYRKFTALVANSESMKKEYLLLGIPENKITVIPNGVDCARFAPKPGFDRESIRREIGVKSGQKLILTVGRNHPKKGFKYIPQIIKRLSGSGLDFKWLLVGKNSSEIKMLAKKEGVDTFIITHEELRPGISVGGELEVPHDKLIQYYQASDIFVFPTLLETFGIVLLDAMAAGLAIVTTDAPGVNELIEHGLNGLKSRAKDPEGMADLIIKVFSDQGLQKRLGQNALLAAKGYDWRTVVSRYIELYKKISHTAGKAKIAHVITDLDIGGAELMLLKILRNSDINSYSHLVISLKSRGKVAKGIEAAGVRVISLNMKWYNFPLCLWKLYCILKAEKPDIAHNYLFHAELAGRICGRMAGVPVVISSLRSVDVGSNFRRLLLRLTDNLVNAVTAVSEKVAYEHVSKKVTKKEKVKVIYNGLEPDRRGRKENRDELRRKIGILPAEYLVLSVGNLRPVKGYSFVFDAVKMLKEKGKDVKLLIVGGGSYRRNLEIEAADKGIRDKVVFGGEREDVSDFLSMADTFVMASLWEGLPNSLLEAMQAGLPVVATRVGGIPEVVRHNENGLLVYPKDSRALADAIERMIKDETLGRRLAESAKSYVKENFDIRKTVAETEKLYERLLRPFPRLGSGQVGARNDTSTKIKVLRIITRMNIGGPARQAVLLSSELGKKDFDCVLLTGSLSESEGDMSYIAAESGIKPIIIPDIGREISFLNDISAFFKIYNIMRKERPQIVHTHTAKAGSIGRLAAKMCGVPVIIHTFHGHVFHSYFSPAKTNFFLAIERMLASLTDKIVTISEKQKDEIKQYLRLRSDNKLALIPLGFDLQKFLTDKDESALRSEFDIPKDALVIGIVGRLTAVKDHATFLKAAKEIKARNTGKVIKFVIVGGGELKDDLVKLARDLGLKDDVIFTGWRRDVDALYRVMDIVALTSLNEGTPVSVIEALASAKPVVATDVGGIRDVVENSKSGFVVPSGDINIFSDKVTLLLNDKNMREQFGLYGREYVCQKYSKSRLVNDIEKLYHEELAKKSVKFRP